MDRFESSWYSAVKKSSHRRHCPSDHNLAWNFFREIIIKLKFRKSLKNLNRKASSSFPESIFDQSKFLTESKNMVRYCGPITGRWVGGPIDHNSKVVIIGSNFESKVFIQSGTFYFFTGCFKIKRNNMAFTNTLSSYNDDYDYILVIMNSKWYIIAVY